MSAAKEYLLLERLLLTARSEGSLRPEAETGLVDRMELLEDNDEEHPHD